MCDPLYTIYVVRTRGEGGQKTFATFTVNGFQRFQHPQNLLIQNVSQADG